MTYFMEMAVTKIAKDLNIVVNLRMATSVMVKLTIKTIIIMLVI